MPKFDGLLAWRRTLLQAPVTPEILAESLTCEALRYEDTPTKFKPTVTAFRHLRRDARVAACRRWLAGLVE